MDDVDDDDDHSGDEKKTGVLLLNVDLLLPVEAVTNADTKPTGDGDDLVVVFSIPPGSVAVVTTSKDFDQQQDNEDVE